MDLDFGVLDVAQRHSLYDSDEEDEVMENPAGIFSVRSQAKLQGLSKPTLLIAVGQTAAIFVKSYLFLEPEPLSVMTTSSQKVFKNRFFAEKATDEVLPVSELYVAKLKSSGNSFLVCVHEQPLNSEYCNLWSLKLFEHVHPEAVLILHSLPSHEHFSSHYHGDTSLLRSLQSSSWPHPCHTHFLEAPNTVKGEAAAALTHCQVYNMAAFLVVLYATSSQSTAECVAALQPVLQEAPLSDLVEIKANREYELVDAIGITEVFTRSGMRQKCLVAIGNKIIHELHFKSGIGIIIHILLDSECLEQPEREATQIVKQLLPKLRHDLSTLYT